jgi:hypothetical protein
MVSKAEHGALHVDGERLTTTNPRGLENLAKKTCVASVINVESSILSMTMAFS